MQVMERGKRKGGEGKGKELAGGALLCLGIVMCLWLDSPPPAQLDAKITGVHNYAQLKHTAWAL